MNSQPETQNPDQIRSDIETTRQRMDNTMDAIGERLHGRHLLDEIIGYFRSSESSSGTNGETSEVSDTANRLKEKAGSALSAVADTVKNNPVPALVIGAGVAWLIYESRRGRRRSDSEANQPENYYRRPLEYPSPIDEEMEFSAEFDDVPEGETEGSSTAPSEADRAKNGARERADAARDIVHEKLERVREGASHLRERASELGSRVQARTKEIYIQGRDRVVRTANEQPLAVGLGVLTLGVIVGLALPTPEKVNQVAGPTADRLRQKARESGQDYIERGRRVARAAAAAARSEAQKQGLTFDALREKARSTETQPASQSQNASGQNGEPSSPPSGAGTAPAQNSPLAGEPAGNASPV